MDAAAAAPIFDHMSALADPVRCRMVLLLEAHELTVSELCAVLQMPQSSVSRHLKTLADDGWLTSRREGTSRLYSVDADALDPGARRLWPIIRDQVGGTVAATHDDRRLRGVLARRRAKSEAFFSSAAGQWDHLREELFGSAFHFRALLALLSPDLVVGDLGCGTGQTAEALAPWVKQVIAVDASADMLQAARRRLKPYGNVEVRRGDLESLPIEPAALDAATLVLVLHHAPDPARSLAAVARALRPGGRLLIVDMLPHERQEYRQQMGHVWLGFPEKQVARLLAGAGFERARVQPLPADPEVKGPSLFVATAVRRSGEEST